MKTETENPWIDAAAETPEYELEVEISEDGVTLFDEAVYLEQRTCMLAGDAGGHGYFNEGWATNGDDYGLIIDAPTHWRYIIATPLKD